MFKDQTSCKAIFGCLDLSILTANAASVVVECQEGERCGVPPGPRMEEAVRTLVDLWASIACLLDQ